MNDKEFAMAYKEFENKLRTTLNEAQLPLIVKLMILRDAERSLSVMVNKMMEEDDVHSD